MKRFVSYLYSIYNNQKIHNAGFARMELRTGRNRVDIHLKENGYAGKTGTVYLFIRKQKNIQGISIGNIVFRGNQADFRFEQAEENIGQTPWQIAQMNGILVVVDERPAFLSQWDEQPVDTAKFEIWQENQSEPIEQRQTKRNPDQANATMKESEQNTTAEDKMQRKHEVDLQNQIKEDNPVAEENTGMQESTGKPENTGIRESTGMEENTGIRESTGMEEYTGIRESMGMEKNTGIRESTGMQENTGVQESTGTERYTGMQEYAGIQENTNMEMEEESALFERMGDAKEYEQTEHPGNIRTAELQPQPVHSWMQTWRYMLRIYPVLHQFADQKNVLCVRIEIKDVRLLPEKYWSMVNNSFLLHGFFNYRYLVFGRIGQNWFIGIPGIYQKQEHVMASVFGFPDFLPQREKNDKGEQPGYWYRILAI